MGVDISRFLPQFFEEAEVCLGELERSLAVLGGPDWDAASAERASRAAHCIKGNSGAFGFDEVGALSAEIEYALRQSGAGVWATNPSFREDCEHAFGVLNALLQARRAGVCGDRDRAREAANRLRDWQALNELGTQR